MAITTLYTRNEVTLGDFSPVVGVINWIMLVCTVLSVCTRIIMKIVVSRELSRDDFVISCAMVFSIAQSIAVAVQVGHGIGQHQSGLSQAELVVYQKAEYSSDLFFVLNLALSKIAVILLLLQITPVVSHQRAARGTIILVAVWSFASLFASTFQCAVPQTWRILGTRCFDQTAFWTFYGAMNILSEIIIVALSVIFLWDFKRKARWTVIACFAIRLSIVGAVITQLVFLHRLSNSDKTFDGWPYELCTLIVQNLSVITGCVPFVKNFMIGLESGMIRIDDEERRRKMSNIQDSSGGSSNYGRGAQHAARKPSAPSAVASGGRADDLDLELRDIDSMPLTTKIRPEDVHNTTIVYPAPRRQGQGSQDRDEGGRIRATTEITVNRGL